MMRSSGVVAGTIAAVSAWVIVMSWGTGLVLSDRWWWSQWLAWLPGIVGVAGTVLGFVAAQRPDTVRRRRRRTLIWGALLLAAGFHFIAIENRLLRRPPPHESTAAFRIAHWNISSRHRHKRWAAPERMYELEADLYILTDAYVAPWRPRARERFGDEAYLARVHPFGFVSKLPILEARPLVAVDGIFAVLLRIDGSESAFGREVTIMAIDLPSDLSLSRMEVVQRLRWLLDELEAQPEEIADIVIGDFNITRGSASLSTLLPGMRHAWLEAGWAFGGTYPRTWPLWHIDHTFVDPSTMRVVDYELIDMGLVRHRLQRVVVEPRN